LGHSASDAGERLRWFVCSCVLCFHLPPPPLGSPPPTPNANQFCTVTTSKCRQRFGGRAGADGRRHRAPPPRRHAPFRQL
jgi:hypothetical protein